MNLLVEIDGHAVPLKDCFWVRYEPDGCASGSTLGDEATSPEQAHERFTPTKRERAREEKAGYRHELVTHDRWDAEAKPCLLGKCQHAAATVPGQLAIPV
jgi:hypothetical protein